ncbi:MAG: tetratricopeptide repeat protein [Acidobacteria bacterium]|nr:tetratricopeptide repeat protein [Acidobacteriota bacterium]
MRSFLLLLITAAFLTAANGQDLGSSNKLFSGGKTPSTSKKAATKKATTSKPMPSRTSAKTKTPTPKPKVTAKKATSEPKPKATSASTGTGKRVFKPIGAKPTTAKVTTARNDTKKVEPPVRKPPPPAKLDPHSAERFDELIDEGNAARDAREYATAETAYQRAKAIDPTDPRADYGLGALYSDQQRWEESEAAYRKALEMDPKDGVTDIALSYVLTQPVAASNLSERYEEAEQLARKANELLPRNALALDQLGVALELRGLIGAETEIAYRKATQLDPDFAPAYAHLGRLLRRRGMNTESAAAYKTAVELARDVPTQVLIAEVFQSEQRYSESEPLLRRALNGDPRNPSALLLLGRALSVRGAFEDAEAIIMRALNVSPNGFAPSSLLASIYFRQGRYEAAEASLMQASRYVSIFDRLILAEQFEQLGNAYKQSGRPGSAERMFQQASLLTSAQKSVSERKRRE